MKTTPKHRATTSDHNGLILVALAAAFCLATGVGIGAAGADAAGADPAPQSTVTTAVTGIPTAVTDPADTAASNYTPDADSGINHGA